MENDTSTREDAAESTCSSVGQSIGFLNLPRVGLQPQSDGVSPENRLTEADREDAADAVVVGVQPERTLTPWHISHRADPDCLALVNVHYNRQTPDSPQFAPPGRCKVFKAWVGRLVKAVWITSWPEFAQHAWKGAWINSLFRNEGAGLSSQLIRQAVAITRGFWEPPTLGIITFVDPNEVVSGNPGYCYLMAGFRRCGATQSGKLAFQMLPADMPRPIILPGGTMPLWQGEAPNV